MLHAALGDDLFHQLCRIKPTRLGDGDELFVNFKLINPAHRIFPSKSQGEKWLYARRTVSDDGGVTGWRDGGDGRIAHRLVAAVRPDTGAKSRERTFYF